jgi:hypothetical protein
MEPSTSTRNAVCTASTLLRLLPLSHFPPSFSLSIPPTHGSRSRVRFGIIPLLIPLQMGACGCSRTQIGSLFLQLEASRDFGGISAIFELGETRKSQVPPALRSSARTERAHHVSII